MARPHVATRRSVAAAAPLPAPPAEWLLAALVALAAWDIFRMVFFADDLLFMDVARRIPLDQLALGQYGVWPWYRPLSRELFFWVLAHTGPAAIALAHVAGLLCLWAATLAVWRLAERLIAGPAAVAAPVLFATCQYTKFVTGWASGFQDLLAATLVLWSVTLHARGRRRLALVLAGLAPFAKETGFVAGPLVIAWSVLCEGERRPRRWMLGHVAVAALAAAVHVVARMTWTMGGTSIVLHPSVMGLARELGWLMGGFVTLPRNSGGLPVVFGILAGICVAYLVRRPREAAASPGHPGAGGDWFIALACAVGLAPMVGGQIFRLTQPLAYHGVPALPWIALALARLARRVPVPALNVGLVTLAAVNVWGLAFHVPHRSSPAHWQAGRLDWFESVRISEVTRHLSSELRRLFPTPPESLVVLYSIYPAGSLFQTGDGPAVREALRDPTARAYLINHVPVRVTPGRFSIITYDGDLLRLREESRDMVTTSNYAAGALAIGRPFTALAWALHADPAVSTRFELTYARAGARLMTDGIEAYIRDMGSAGFLDSTGLLPRLQARMVAQDEPGLVSAYEGLLRQPLTASAHVALAETLLARGATVGGAVMLRVATNLDPSRLADQERLRVVLAGLDEVAADRQTHLKN